MSRIDAIKRWDIVKLGSYGWDTKFDSNANGDAVTGTDSFGCYHKKLADAEFTLLTDKAHIPAGTPALVDGLEYGCWDIKIAPSDPNRVVMAFGTSVYVSSNRAQAFVECAGAATLKTPTAFDMDGNGTERKHSQGLIAIDPRDPNHWFISTMSNGMFETTDNGQSFTPQSTRGLPTPIGQAAGAKQPSYTSIMFDFGSGANGTTGRTQRVTCFVLGKGLYVRATDTGNWALATGSPVGTTDWSWDCDMDSAGKFYFVIHHWPYSTDAGMQLWSCTRASNQCTLIATINGLKFIAVNPLNDNHLVRGGKYGGMDESINGGANWTAMTLFTFTATDQPGIACRPRDATNLIPATVKFHKGIADTLVCCEGEGLWRAQRSQSAISTTVAWNSMTAPIEQSIAVNSQPGPDGKMVGASWDKPNHVIQNIDGTRNPSKYEPNYFDYNSATLGNFSLNPTTITDGKNATVSTDNPNWWGLSMARGFPARKSGVSLDGMLTLQQFNAIPTSGVTVPEIGLANDQYVGGCVRLFDAGGGVPGAMWFPHLFEPKRTLNVNATPIVWGSMTFPLITNGIVTGTAPNRSIDSAGWPGFYSRLDLRARVVAADHVNPNVFYAYHFIHGHFRSVNKGAAWQHMRAPIATAAFHRDLRALPGKEGHLIFCTGAALPDNPNEASTFFRSKDGGQSWEVPGTDALGAIRCCGYGKARPGSNYPAVAVFGYVNGVLGVHVTYDEFKTWETLHTGTVLGKFDWTIAIDGSLRDYGVWYAGFGGSGWAWTNGGAPAETKYLELRAA